MNKIKVESVKSNDVTLTFGAAKVSFSVFHGQVRMTSKINIYGGNASVYLPKNIFNKMARQAAAILDNRERREGVA